MLVPANVHWREMGEAKQQPQWGEDVARWLACGIYRIVYLFWKIEDGTRGHVHMYWRATTHNVAILRRDLGLALPRGSKSRAI